MVHIIFEKGADAEKSLNEISIKFKLITMELLHTQWIIYVLGQLLSFEEKKIILAEWKAAGISDALKRGFARFKDNLIDHFYHINPIDQGVVHFNISLVVSPTSEEFVEKEMMMILMIMI